MAMPIKNKHRLYGELLCHFANAETTNEAGRIYVEDIKRAFHFPEKIKSLIDGRLRTEEWKEFPTISKFKSSLNKEEDQLLDIFVNEKQILSEILSIIDSREFRYKSYDPSNKFPR